MNLNPFIMIDNKGNMKSFDFSPWGGIEGFLEASKAGAGNGAQLVNYVPDLYRAVDMTATAISSLPFDICNEEGEVIDSSVDWQNEIGGMDSPQSLLYKIASSLCGGAAYVFPRVLSKRIVDMTYFAPHTITPQIDRNGLQYFDRASDLGTTERLQPDELLYFWLPDRNIEIGPAKASPLSNAALPASLKLGMNEAIKSSAERGFVPPTLLAAKGMPPGDEKTKTETWWNRFLRNGFREVAKVVNAEAIDIKTLGAGMEQLKGSYVEINREASEDIGKAFGIPAALFMSDNAYASEFKQIRKQWKSESVFVTIYKTIEETFTTQLLYPKFGLYMYFRPETLDEFQDDENAKAQSVSTLTNAINTSPEVAKWSMSVLGYDLTQEQEDELDEIIAGKEEDSQQNMELQRQRFGVEQQPQEDTQDSQPVEEQEEQPTAPVRSLSPEEMKDLVLWRTKAKSWFLKGKGAAVDWENKHLPESIAAPIRVKLANAKNELDITKAFELGEQKPVSDIRYLADVLNKALNDSR